MNQPFIKVNELKNILSTDKNCKIIDVRELSEFENEHIANSLHTPLSKIDHAPNHLDKNHFFYILCKTGNRACKAGDKLHELGYDNFKVIEGGIDAWKNANLPTQKGNTNVWSMERQVRFTAGLLMTTGLCVGYFINPAGFILSAVIGGGLIFSAVTNTCGMGIVLLKMPWNK